MLELVGVFVIATAIAIAAFTSNIFISEKERELARRYRFQRETLSGKEKDYALQAYMNVLIARCSRASIVLGLIFVFVGFLFR